MAEHDNTTPAPLGDRYVPATVPIRVWFYIPQKDRRRRVMVQGTLRGAMHMRGQLRHYRVAGDDGVLYLAPVAWFAPGQSGRLQQRAFAAPEQTLTGKRVAILMLVREIAANLGQP